MVVRSADEQLRTAFQSHLQESEVHVTRLEQILHQIKAHDPSITSVEAIRCKGVKALIEETDDMLLDAKHSTVRDAALIAAAQRVEHYEIAAYGALRHFAQVLGEGAAAELLDKTIHEEGNADHLLSTIAERINPNAKRAA
jgi:ferritin-like metal-binding protein YciE